MSYINAARKEYKRKHNQENKDKYNELRNQLYYKRKNDLILMLGGKCIKCESINNLQFDHIDPNTKIANLTYILCSSLDKTLEEIKKCQLLCYDCHRKKHGKSEHGGGTQGIYKCKCHLCKEKRLEYQREYYYRKVEVVS